MARSQSHPKRASRQLQKTTRGPARRRGAPPRARDYAREAISEWGKAMRYAAAAIPARLGSSSASVQNSPKTEKGGRLGDVADFLLSKTGKPGALASKFALGSRIVDPFRGNDAGSPKASVS